jgi:transposase
VACLLTVKTTLKSLGLRIQKSSSPCFAGRAREYLVDQPEILCLISPSLIVLESLTDQIKILDKKVDALIKDKYPAAQRLRQIQGVGPITSLSFALYIDPNNFKHTRDVGAYLGLVPRRDQSGKIDKQLSISKTGNTKLRCLLVQASHYIMGPFGPECDLRKHGLKLASKGGKIAKRKAVVAVARKLSVVMLTLLQQQSDYRPIMKPTSEKVA